MRKLLLLIVASLSIVSCKQNSTINLSQIYGVWANENVELVQTGNYTLFFERTGDDISVTLRKIEYVEDTVYTNFLVGYKFIKADSVYQKIECPIEQQRVRIEKFITLSEAGELKLVDSNDKSILLESVEKIEICPAYDVPQVNKTNIAECLQKWVIGTKSYNLDPKDMYIEINTNEHVYIFSANERSVYCRAARQRSNENGTVFVQNIRLMKNAREFTVYMAENNLKESLQKVEIDNSLFSPDICVFADNARYWSVGTMKADTIQINGCGTTYIIPRPDINDKKTTEWFVYKAY